MCVNVCSRHVHTNTVNTLALAIALFTHIVFSFLHTPAIFSSVRVYHLNPNTILAITHTEQCVCDSVVAIIVSVWKVCCLSVQQ